MQALEKQCPVCCNPTSISSMHSIAQCQHTFCKECCLMHIQARLEAFEDIYCLQSGCKQRFTKLSAVYQYLGEPAKRKFCKYEQFVLLQTHKNLKPCKAQQCLGVLDINKQIHIDKKNSFLICTQCSAHHCTKCFQRSHDGLQCNQPNAQQKQQQQKLMKRLNYRKCPSCSVWVEKNGGCQYLVCKCKTQFCFNCGQTFDKDPCRKISSLQNQKQIWELSRISKHISQPKSALDYLLFILKTILKLIFLPIYTCVTGLLFMGFMFAIFIPLIYLASPAGIIVLIGQTDDFSSNMKLFLRIMTVLLYPLIGFIASIGVLLLFLTYPIMRQILQTHIYDEMDRGMGQVTIVYLRGIACILKI